ncbi:MAG TPA: EamA family transporter [Anaerolineales bacterium]|nr:EamA family transporter [Anaerolineales bacterium]
METSFNRGYLICFTGTVLWSFTAIFIRHLNEAYNMPPLVLAFWRDALVFAGLAIVFLLFAPARLKVSRNSLVFLLFYGLVLSLFNSLWTVSVALNGAAVSTVLAYSSAAFTALFGWRLFGESLRPLKLLAVGLSLLGCIFVAGAHELASWGSNPLGILTGLLSGLAFASYSLMGKAASRRGLPPWTALLYTFMFAAVFLLAYNQAPGWLPRENLTGDLLWLGKSASGWGILLALALVPTIGGYGLYTVSLNYLPASVANLIATLEPAMTAVSAYLLLGEILTPTQLFGSALILAGVVVLRLSEGRAASLRRPVALS